MKNSKILIIALIMFVACDAFSQKAEQKLYDKYPQLRCICNAAESYFNKLFISDLLFQHQ